MCRMVKRATGQTPGEYRRAAAGMSKIVNHFDPYGD